MTDKCACCGQPATHKISSEEPVFEEIDGMKMHGHPYTNYVCDDCFRLIMHKHNQYFAAGPWQSMDVKSPEHEDVLVRLNNGDVYIARRLPDNRWVAEISPDHHEQAEGQLEHEMGFCEYLKSELLAAWARINLKEDADA